MRMTSKQEETERLAFAERAAACFAMDDTKTTYTDNGKVENGEYFAVRWGLGKDCVLVFKIHEYAPIVNYQEIIKKASYGR